MGERAQKTAEDTGSGSAESARRASASRPDMDLDMDTVQRKKRGGTVKVPTRKTATVLTGGTGP